MKKILIVEDMPELKVDMLIRMLEIEKVEFEYEIVKSITSAKRYLSKRGNKVDVIISDLGLPIFDDEMVTNLLEGVGFIDDLKDFDIKVPVIINSTTSIPNYAMKKSNWERNGLEVYKTEFILSMKNWFVAFLTAK